VTETTDQAEPFAEFYDEPTFLSPGPLTRWHHEEARERAEEQRKGSRTHRAG
jgi:hypothetical protein